MNRFLATFVTGVAVTTGAALAQDTAATTAETTKPMKVLTIGDKAPSIKDVTWIKGTGVESFKKGEAYVVECWATWCGPSIAGIPHLTTLQKEYKDKKIQILGIAIWQQDDEMSDEAIMEKVTSFVEAQGDKMNYTVGLEKGDFIGRNWMKPAGQNGIPCAYLVGKEGHIEWIGHPGSIDPVLKSYSEGEWDRAAFAVEYRKQQAAEKAMTELYEKLYAAQASGNMEESIRLIDDAMAKHPDIEQLKMMKFTILVESDTHTSDAYALGERIVKDSWDDPQLLNMISWNVLDNPAIKHRDFDFALKAAERANNLTNNEDPMILDTLARAWFEKGEVNKAIAIQERAVQFAPEGMEKGLKETLEAYMADQAKVG